MLLYIQQTITNKEIEMTTKTTSTEKTMNGKTIKVTLNRGVFEEEIRLDGQLTGTKSHLFDKLEIFLFDGTKRLESGSKIDSIENHTRHPNYQNAVKAGCVGLVGRNWFVKSETENVINEMIDIVASENPITEEMITLKNQEAEKELIAKKNMEAIEKMEREQEKHAGWCKICKDWTYGDCGH